LPRYIRISWHVGKLINGWINVRKDFQND
jgi:hypothetical protein